MAKLNKNYVSVYEFLVEVHFPLMDVVDKFLYKGHTYCSPKEEPFEQLKGAFQPLQDMVKDAVDTFKPYRSWYYVKRDALQPLYGLGNIAKGLFSLLVLLPLSIYILGVSILKERSIIFGCAVALSWFIDALLSIVRGVTQIAATPLVLIKMIARTINWCFADEKDLLIENKPGIQNLVKQAQAISDNYRKDSKTESLENLAMIADLVDYKYYYKGIKRHEKTNFNSDQAYSGGATADTFAKKIVYLKLFGFRPAAALEQIEPDETPSTGWEYQS